MSDLLGSQDIFRMSMQLGKKVIKDGRHVGLDFS
jgi:hypothetical protein